MPTELISSPCPAVGSATLRLHDLIGECEDALLDSWSKALCGASPMDSKAREGVVSFLAELKAALRQAAGGDVPSLPTSATETETEDPGEDVDLAAATRGYGFLHGSILELAAGRGVEVTPAEQRTLASRVSAAVARAVAGYLKTQQRELHRLAHELRNPLGSALMALALLRARADLGDHVRLAEMMERNLQRLEGGLDAALARGRRFEPGSGDLGR